MDAMVQQLKDRNLLIDDHLSMYRDLLIYKLTEDYLRSKLHDTDDELLAGETSPTKRSNDFYNYIKSNDKEDEELLLRYVDINQDEMAELQDLSNELVGNNIDQISNHVVITTTGTDGQPQQFLVEQPQNIFHIGQSLVQQKSIAMTIFNPKLIKGRPTAEFLPGELRNKDYVKGDMASDIYQKTVKGPLGQRGLSKSNALAQFNANTTGNFKKRGRPPKNTGETNNKNETVEVVNNENRVPQRPKIRRRNGELRSLKDLDKTNGSANYKLDYDPIHFIRCHAKDSVPHDQETKVWRCAFEPDPNMPGATTHNIATCGGECVCIIDCEAGKVIKRYKRDHEEFMTLAWTVLEDETGKRITVLAAAGKLKEIRVMIPDHGQIDMKGHLDDIASLVFHPSLPQILFSGDTKASIIVWDVGTVVKDELHRYQLLMRFRCPRLDVNPVLNLVFLDHYSYLIAGCEDAIFAWKVTEFRIEKREREPDMELKLCDGNKVDVQIKFLSYDGLAQLGRTALVFKVVTNPSLLVFDFGTTLERRKGLQKVVPIEVCGKLDWQKNDDYYINVSTRSNLGAVLCGDNAGNIWIYDLDPYIEENPEKVTRGFNCAPFKILDWPDCGTSGPTDDQFGNAHVKNPVINTVDMSSDGMYVVGVTDNNLVCIWQLTKDD